MVVLPWFPLKTTLKKVLKEHMPMGNSHVWGTDMMEEQVEAREFGDSGDSQASRSISTRCILSTSTALKRNQARAQSQSFPCRSIGRSTRMELKVSL